MNMSKEKMLEKNTLKPLKFQTPYVSHFLFISSDLKGYGYANLNSTILL